MSEHETKQDLYENIYSRWLSEADMPLELKEELLQIQDQFKEVEDRFYKDLEFGTAGIRGLLGAGTNRINVYTVRKTAQGLARYVREHGQAAMDRGIAIAYDSRKYSKEFAGEIANLLARNGIKVYVFQEISPTPLLSYAIRKLGAFAGLVITASHNPPMYNGIKVYNEEGGQINEESARRIYEKIQEIADPLRIDTPRDNKAEAAETVAIGAELFESYLNDVEGLLQQRARNEAQGHSLSIVYTPLHGAGAKLVPSLLKRAGFGCVHIVSEQEQPDWRFPTVNAPNPEDPDVFALALTLAEEKRADVILATDPDADRLGVLARTAQGYSRLNGNQLGALVLHYLLEQKAAQGELAENGLLLKTIVTSDLGQRIAESHQVKTINTVTGFKFIADKIEECKRTGEHTFLFGYEESYGYLAGDFVRDKDAVQMTAIVSEMVLFYKGQGKDLFQVLEEIYEKYGYYQEELLSFTLPGKEGQEKIQAIMSALRHELPEQIAGIAVRAVEDYQQQTKIMVQNRRTEPLELPSANVVKILLADGSWVAIRPSGTEPKIKIYLSAFSQDTKQDADAKLSALQDALSEMFR
ncbi:phospho-sugar mutase [Brevibacillus fluminis]|uniref:phospho-sugar mutase n=1 Tax=Brevibacillus fluminis TaxID=511487 RepID=UPI003F8B0E61